MNADVEALLKRLKGLKSFDDLRRDMRAPGEQQALLHCAIALTFDRELFDQVLVRDLKPDHRPKFEEFTRREWAEEVPQTKDVFRLRESERRAQLGEWHAAEKPAALVALARGVAAHYAQQGPGADGPRLFALLHAVPEEALALFEQLYAEADERFDLPRCHDLLTLCESAKPLLSDAGSERLIAQRAYLRSRAMWASDYYRTAFFLDRPRVTKGFDQILKPGPWIWQLNAMGGMGKTICLRWFVTRRCVPQRVPCARIDFDFFDPLTASEHPWLLLLKIASQLDEQLPGQPFSPVLLANESYRVAMERQETAGAKIKSVTAPSEAEREVIVREVVARLRKITSPVVVVFDTLEEVMVHQQADLGVVLTQMTRLHEACPSLRIILAGRNDPIETQEEFAGYAAQLQRLDFPLFTPEEAREYFIAVRRLAPGRPIVPAIQRADGSPFKLALLADLLLQRPDIDEGRMNEFPKDVDLVYLVERVLERISKEAQWLLRYGVIPRRLTKDFVHDVLWRFLPDAMSRTVDFDRPERDVSREFKRPKDAYWRNDFVAAKLSPDQAWDAIKAYASGASWLTAEQNVLVFHPSVLDPMRALLAKHPAHRLLHAAAAEYFHRRSETQPEHWGEHRCEAVYHRFQAEGADAGGAYWQQAFDDARAEKNDGRRKLVLEILRPDYVEPDGQPRREADGTPVISLSTLAQAHYGMVRVELDDPRRMAQARRHFDEAEKLEAGSGGPVLSPLSRSSLRARLEPDSAAAEDGLLAGAFETLGETSEAPGMDRGRALQRILDLVQRHWRNYSPREQREWLMFATGYARRVAASESESAVVRCEQLLGLVDAVEAPPSAAGRLLHVQLAHLHHTRGEFGRVEKHFEAAHNLARSAGDWADAETLALQLGQFELQFNLLDSARERIENHRRGMGPLNEDRWSVLAARVHLALGDPRRALQSCEEALHGPGSDRDEQERLLRADLPGDSVARFREVRGRALADLMDFEQASAEFERAADAWKGEGNQSAHIAQCQLAQIEMELEDRGDWSRAAALIDQAQRLLGRGEEFPPEIHVRIQRAVARLHAVRNDVGLARDTLLQALTQSLDPRLAGLVLAELVALEPTEQALIDLRKNLERLEPGDARLPLLRALRRCRPDVVLDVSPAERRLLVAQFEIARRDRAWAANAVLLLPLLRLIGETARAKDVFEGLRPRVRDERALFLWRAVVQAAPELAVESGREMFERLDRGFRDFPLVGVACRIEAAEHCVNTERWKEAAELIAPMPAEIDATLGRPWGNRYRQLRELIPQMRRTERRLAGMPFEPAPPVESKPGLAARLMRSVGLRPRELKLALATRGRGAGLEVRAQWDEEEPVRFEVKLEPILAEVFQRGAAGPLSDLTELWPSIVDRFFADLGQDFERRLEPTKHPFQVRLAIAASDLNLASFPWELWWQHRGRTLTSLKTLHSFERGISPPLVRSTDPQKTGDVLILGVSQARRSTSSSQSADAGDLVQLYRRQGQRPVVLEDPTSGDVAEAMQSIHALRAVHICGSLRYAAEQAGSYLDFAASRSHALESRRARGSSLFQAPSLARELSAGPPWIAPLVILDVPRPHDGFEVFHQLFVRNGFAAQLQSLLPGWPVLAAGLGDRSEASDLSRRLIESAAQRRPVAEVAQDLRRAARPDYDKHPFLDEAGTLGVALFHGAPSFPPPP